MLTEQMKMESNKKNTNFNENYAPNPLLQIKLSESGVSSNAFEQLHFELRQNDNKRQELNNPDDYNLLHYFLSKKLEIDNTSAFIEEETLPGQENPDPLEAIFSFILMLEVRIAKPDESINFNKSLYFNLTLLDNGCQTLKSFNDHNTLHSVISPIDFSGQIGAIQINTKDLTIVNDLGIEVKSITEDLSDDELFNLEECDYQSELIKGYGEGIVVYKNSERFDMTQEDDKINDYREVSYVSGDKYIGQQKGKLKHGCGEYNYLDGAKYIGEWNDNKKNGCGEETDPDGTKYIGEWLNNDMNGVGEETDPDGSKYIGEWRDDKNNGYGEEIYPSGAKYTGEYKDDIRHGYGEYTYPSGAKYIGEWKDDKKHGYGEYTHPDGSKYTGEYKNDKKHGYGKQTEIDGYKYTVEWKDDNMNGYGEENYPNGAKYIGEYKDDERHGYGVKTSQDGDTRKKIYEDGEIKMRLR